MTKQMNFSWDIKIWFFVFLVLQIEITLGKSEKFDELMTAANEEKEEQQKLRYRAEHSLLLISDAFVFTHPQTQVVSPPLFSSHSHTLSRCRTFSFHLSG